MSTWAGPPKWYARGRARPIQVIVVHNTQGNEGPTKAEAGVAYDKIRLDSVSCHCFADSQGDALEEVRDTDTAYHARNHGNAIGWGLELCGLSQQTPAQWQDATSQATLRTAARECAARVRKWGWSRSDIRRLTVAQTRAAYYAAPGSRPRGFCGHVDISNAFPEDNGTHWDPGPAFPWDQFLGMVRAEYDGETGAPDVNDLEHEYIINMGKTQAAIAAGEDSVQLIDTVNGVDVKGPVRDLKPYWARIAAEVAKNPVGTVTVDIGEEDIAAIAEASADATADELHNRTAE